MLAFFPQGGLLEGPKKCSPRMPRIRNHPGSAPHGHQLPLAQRRKPRPQGGRALPPRQLVCTDRRVLVVEGTASSSFSLSLNVILSFFGSSAL